MATRWIALLLALAPVAAWAQGITVTANPERLPARNQAESTITVQVDIATTPQTPGVIDQGDPTFDISASAGTLQLLSTELAFGNAEPAGPMQRFKIARLSSEGLRRARGEARLLYRAPDSAQPGEVVISVEGSQGIRLIGVASESDIFRGQGRVILVRAGAGAPPPSAPPGKPPFQPTSSVVNPTEEMIVRAGIIAGLLAAAAGIRFTVTRPNRKPLAEAKPQEQPKPVREALPEPRQQTQSGVVNVTVTASSLYANGNGACTLTFDCDVVPSSKSLQYEILGDPVWAAIPERFQVSGDGFKGKLTAPWEWHTTDVEIQAKVRIKVKGTAPSTQTGSVTVRIFGAEPQWVAKPDPVKILANGRHGTQISCELWLFGEPSGERAVIDNVVAKIDGKDCDDVAGKSTSEVPAWADWRPPFLMQEPGYAEVVRLTVKARWVEGGPMYGRATKPIPQIADAWCEVIVRGCQVQFAVSNPRFLPLAGAPLTAKGKLLDAESRSLSQYAWHGQVRDYGFELGKATLTCEVRDLSQAKPDSINGCKIPPKSPFDLPLGESPDSSRLKAAIDEKYASTKPRVTSKVEVGELGVLHSQGDADEIQLWNYQIDQGNEPIHNGAVLVSLVVNDGFGGRVEVRQVCRVELGTLVLETGGLDFRIYEQNLFSFDVEHVPSKNVCDSTVWVDGYGNAPYIPGQVYSLGEHGNVPDPQAVYRWEFARLDQNGDPHPAGVIETSMKAIGSKGTVHFLVGYARKDQVIFHRPASAAAKANKDEPEVLQFRTDVLSEPKRNELLSQGYRQVEAGELGASLAFRKIWHAFVTPTTQRDYQETGLPWLGTESTPSPWLDTALPMAVRIELRDRNRNLIATSDRVFEGGVRTMGKTVWRDHQFRYVLLKFRAMVVDSFGDPRRKLPYFLKVDGQQGAVSGDTGDNGLVEQLAPPDAEQGTLDLMRLEGEFDFDNPLTSFKLRFGLDPPDTIFGQQARLNNLGLYAGGAANGKADDRLRRALLQFQELAKLDLTGEGDVPTEAQLQAIHDAYGFPSLPPPGSPIEGGRKPSHLPDAPERQGSGMRGAPVEDQSKPGPPFQLTNREAWVALGSPNVLRVYSDPQRSEIGYWFDADTPGRIDNVGNAIYPPSSGNEVQYFIDSPEAFRSMAETMRTARAKGDFIYMLGWWLNWDLELIPGDKSSTPIALFCEASKAGAEVRAMLFNHVVPDDYPKWTAGIGAGAALIAGWLVSWPLALTLGAAFQVELAKTGMNVLNPVNIESYILINKLANGACIMDRRMLATGSHHQKVIVVMSGGQMTGFCGGLDLNVDRVFPQGTKPNDQGCTAGAPFHDVHCRIRGPAVHRLLRTFVERWKDHPDSKEPSPHSNAEQMVKPLAGAGVIRPPELAGGRHHVQIGRTFGNGLIHAGIEGGYDFAPHGERTARQMIVKAIRSARRFIYVEDQYLVSREAREAILEVLPKIHHVTALIPCNSITTMGMHTQEYRNFLIDQLLAAAPDKVRVFILKNPGSPHSYVHSKMWVIDDRYAIIGSANCNRRSYTHDSEIVAGIADDSSELGCTWRFAHQLRVALWAEHLNLDTPEGHAELADGVAAAALWLHPPPGARISPYNRNAPDPAVDLPARTPASQLDWDLVVDPNGS